jgi:hypothetical protein
MPGAASARPGRACTDCLPDKLPWLPSQAGGRVSRLARRWFAVCNGGTGRRFGAHLEIRRNRAGRYFLLEHGRRVRRSHNLYPNDGGSLALAHIGLPSPRTNAASS